MGLEWMVKCLKRLVTVQGFVTVAQSYKKLVDKIFKFWETARQNFLTNSNYNKTTFTQPMKQHYRRHHLKGLQIITLL